MKINQFVTIFGENIVLVPYRKDHVEKTFSSLKDDFNIFRNQAYGIPGEVVAYEINSFNRKISHNNRTCKYHAWMQSEELQKLTASEPLTLGEEYKMQQSWRNDEDKCTFIILDKHKFVSTNDEVKSMIGDTNIFLTNPDGTCVVGEIEIMIAESDARGKRRGWEATLLMLRYGTENLGVKRYQAKISMDNVKSITMFKKMKFKKTEESIVFQEVTLERSVTAEWKKWLRIKTRKYILHEKEV